MPPEETQQKTVFGDAIETFRSARERTSIVSSLLFQAETRVKEVSLKSANVESRVASLREEAALEVQMSNGDVAIAKDSLAQHRRDELAATVAVQHVATAHAADLRDALLPPVSTVELLNDEGPTQPEDPDEDTAPL